MAGPINGPGINSINQQARPGSPGMNLPQALWHVMQIIGTPNHNSQVGSTLGSLANQARSPMNAAMFLGGGRSFDPEQLQAYNLQKAMGAGQIVFREGQPYDIRGAISGNKTNNTLLKSAGYGHTPFEKEQLSANAKAYAQKLHDAMFGGEFHPAKPVRRLPPRP